MLLPMFGCAQLKEKPRAKDISICLIGSEQHKARPDLTNDSGFWIRVKVEDVAPFLTAFNAAPAAFHDFQIEQRVGKQIRSSTLSAKIAKIEEGPTESRVLILPNVPIP